MGSQNSKSQLDTLQQMKNENPILNMNFTTNAPTFSGNSLIKSYYNINPIGQENIKKESFSDTFSSNKTIINTTFKWAYEGEKIFLAGSFNNWKNYIPLKRIGNEFQIILQLTPGIYQYKFVVDGEWKFSPDDQTYTEPNGTVNNMIDLTNYDIQLFNKIYSSNNTLLSHPSIIDPSQSNTIVDESSFNSFSKGYQPFLVGNNQKLPLNDSDTVFNDEAPTIPIHLLSIFHIMEKERKKNRLKEKYCDKQYNFNSMEVEQKNGDLNKKTKKSPGILLAIDSGNALSPPLHVNLNHIGTIKNQQKKI